MDQKNTDQHLPDEGADNDIAALVRQLSGERLKLQQREEALRDQAEELSAQKEELTAAIEEVVLKNNSLENTLGQLRERNFELDQVLYRTSHDLRSPLSSIYGILSLLQREPQSDTIRAYVGHIEKKTVQMDNMLRSLASLSKSLLEDTQLETFDLGKLIWDVVREYRHVPSWNHVEVHVQVEQYRVYSDPYLMTIILQSLLSNAFTFRDQTKKGQLRVRSNERNGRWTIDVVDDGDGIDASVEAAIFNMFYRGSERSTGNGLGLYVAKKAAARLNGTISFHRDSGRTRFTVALTVQHFDCKLPATAHQDPLWE